MNLLAKRIYLILTPEKEEVGSKSRFAISMSPSSIDLAPNFVGALTSANSSINGGGQ
jgi:hypothetical protein